MKYLLVATLALFTTIGCSSQKETTTTTTTERQSARGGDRKGPPSIDKIFEMDANNDGKLSIDEVEGPLEKEFSTIDTNDDGFLSKTEVENAPKPERGGQRPPRN